MIRLVDVFFSYVLSVWPRTRQRYFSFSSCLKSAHLNAVTVQCTSLDMSAARFVQLVSDRVSKTESLREASSDTFLAFKRFLFSRANFAPFSLFQFGQRFGVLPLRASQSARTHATAYPRVTPFAAMGSTVSTPKPPNPEGASAQATVPLTEKPAAIRNDDSS